MGEEEGDADRRLVARREPLVREEDGGAEREAARVELALELADARLEVASLDAVAEVADPEMEQVVVGELFPGDLGG